MTQHEAGTTRRSAVKALVLGTALLPVLGQGQPARGEAVGAGSPVPVVPPHQPSALKAQVAATGVPRVTPEQFGARGDGVTNDTDAFVAMGIAITAAGGAIVALKPRATYLVGKQRFLAGVPVAGDIFGPTRSYLPSRILWLQGLAKGLVILGNGAVLRAANGLRYGTFDPLTGRATAHPMPYMGTDVAYPYAAMIGLHDVTGPVVIERLELDGNSDRYEWGGQRGDTGWQLPGNGMLIEQCPTVVIDRVTSHHHGMDGLQCEAGGTFTVLDSSFHHNCRLNGNLRAGGGFLAINCSFDHAAKGAHFSAPAGGFDLEAEYRDEPIVAPRFVNCRFRHNRYQGMAADSGDISRAVFDNCLFWSGAHGEANPIYISKPGFVFRRCTFGGPMIVLNSAVLPLFDRCLFTDDPARGSLDGTVNLATSNINVATGGVMFRRCSFLLSRSRLPNVSDPRVVFDGCLLVSAPAIYLVISGTYRDCRLLGKAIDLGSSSQVRFQGRTTVNGRPIPPTARAHPGA